MYQGHHLDPTTFFYAVLVFGFLVSTIAVSARRAPPTRSTAVALFRSSRALSALLACALWLTAPAAEAQSGEVALAGFAYSGAADTIEARFPYSKRYEASLNAVGDSAHAKLRAATTQAVPNQFKLVPKIDELKGRDQAIAVALVINSETVSVEEFGNLRKLLVLVRGQALFFDFKSMTVVRSYPVSFAYIDVFDRVPTSDEIGARVKLVYEGAVGKPGLFSRFANALAAASLPTQSSRQLQVTRVQVKPEALEGLPSYLKGSAAVSETWVADLASEALSNRLGIPLIPYSKGYAVGNVMSMSISSGDVYNLTLPRPDYEISVEFSGFKKVKYGESRAGVSFIYGAFAVMKIEEPLSGKVYLNTPIKNGEVKVVPVTQTYVDDFPAYYDAANGLFTKLSDSLAGKGVEWVKTAAGASDVERQVALTMELMKLCK
jgi:hypothetical protein